MKLSQAYNLFVVLCHCYQSEGRGFKGFSAPKQNEKKRQLLQVLMCMELKTFKKVIDFLKEKEI
jgi:predicted ATPase with chaperone activity